jgi:hypothetical protein
MGGLWIVRGWLGRARRASGLERPSMAIAGRTGGGDGGPKPGNVGKIGGSVLTALTGAWALVHFPTAIRSGGSRLCLEA